MTSSYFILLFLCVLMKKQASVIKSGSREEFNCYCHILGYERKMLLAPHNVNNAYHQVGFHSLHLTL